MIKCPMCGAMNDDDARKCRKCQADLGLLAEYVIHLRDGLGEAEKHTRDGNLAEAVWAYLAVLEVDPDNATARRQVGKVVTAVRQFDRTAPGRRWLAGMRKESFWQRWFGSGNDGEEGGGGYWPLLLGIFLLVLGLTVGHFWGMQSGRNLGPPTMPDADEELQKEPPRDDEKAPKRKELRG